MSLTFTCYLLTGESEVFEERVDPGVPLSSLREAIQRELKRRGHDVPLTAISLYQTGISFDPKGTHASQRLDEHQGEALDLDKRVSEVFHGHRPSKLLVTVSKGKGNGYNILYHLLLQFFSLLFLFPKRRCQEDTLYIHCAVQENPYLHAIYRILWKGEFPDHVEPFNPFRRHKVQAATNDAPNQLEGALVGDRDIEVLDFSPLLDLGSTGDNRLYHYTQLLVRESYHEFRQYVQGVLQKDTIRESYIMLLGHPGIGKSALLFVMLCWCLRAKTPVYYQPTRGRIWFFNQDGCEVLKDSDFPDHRTRQPPTVTHYYLFNLDATQSPISIEVVGHTVFIVSTQPATNYKGWAKRIGDTGALTRWWMEPWTEVEIMDYGQFRGDDLEAIRRVFTRFGGSARHCFARKGPSLRMAEREQDGEIEQIVNSSTMSMGALSESPFSPRKEWTSTVAAAFPKVVVREVDHNFPNTQIASVYAATQLASKARPHLVEFIFKHFGELCQSPCIAGKVFETLAHRTLERGLEADLQGLSTPRKVMVALRVNEDRLFNTGNPQITEKTYLRPNANTSFGIDSLLLDQSGVLNLFCITTDTSHRVNAAFLDHIPDAYQTKMRLVFVMPVEEGGKMRKQAIYGGNDRLDVKKIPQFVFQLTSAQVQAAVRR